MFIKLKTVFHRTNRVGEYKGNIYITRNRNPKYDQEQCSGEQWSPWQGS